MSDMAPHGSSPPSLCICCTEIRAAMGPPRWLQLILFSQTLETKDLLAQSSYFTDKEPEAGKVMWPKSTALLAQSGPLRRGAQTPLSKREFHGQRGKTHLSSEVAMTCSMPLSQITQSQLSIMLPMEQENQSCIQ